MPLYPGSKRTSLASTYASAGVGPCVCRLFDGEKAQGRRATPAALSASLLPFLSHSFYYSSPSSSSSSSSSPPSSSPYVALYPGHRYSLRRVYASGSHPSGVRDLARGYTALRWMASQRERSRCVSLFVFLAVDIRYAGYLLRLRLAARALSVPRLHDQIERDARDTNLTIPRFLLLGYRSKRYNIPFGLEPTR